MIKTFSFTTDPKLLISTWSTEAAKLTGTTARTAVGARYDEILPAIVINGKDAIGQAIVRKKPVILNNHRVSCFFSHLTTDITITPRKSRNGRIKDAEIIITPAASCVLAQKWDQSQQLINIGKIASTLVHGIRNPLNALKGAVVYLGDKYTDEQPLVEFTKIMKDEIARLDHFITSFLSTSLSEVEVSRTDINGLLKKIQVYTALQLFTRTIRSSFEFGSAPPIMISPYHLEQIILNVINNAIEAMGSGGQMAIRTYGEEREGVPCAVIEISDTGPGLSSGQIDAPAARAAQTGRGFGLFITYEMLKQYGGHLEIAGKDDAGTRMRIYFPAAAARMKDGQPCKSSTPYS